MTDPIRLRLSAQRALTGAVSPALRSVSLELQGATLRWLVVWDGEPDPGGHERLSVAATEVLADFPEVEALDEQQLTLPAPQPMPHRELVVFLRHEA